MAKRYFTCAAIIRQLSEVFLENINVGKGRGKKRRGIRDDNTKTSFLIGLKGRYPTVRFIMEILYRFL